MMSRTDKLLSFTFGAKAVKVDKIKFTILSDPTRLHSVVSNNPLIRIESEKDTGLYSISIDMKGSDITP
jgi:hypothetical protein